ncbi:uncharacterized protein LOC123671622 [Harmonia axyridis]|uniref:uncharacterized protein LOC123671622 n=1 Tax=Harmonia axyridis TaxID=115357 RepID=UPI001E2763F9|nr:uncharacterized protein LOC123671622 [Harmonia axyridis]
MDTTRKLLMCSDFPYLIRCLRNTSMNRKKKIRNSEGWVMFSYVEELFQHEFIKEFKMAFKLMASHIYSYKQEEKMNTRLAFQDLDTGRRRISWMKNLRTWYSTTTTSLFRSAVDKVKIARMIANTRTG